MKVLGSTDVLVINVAIDVLLKTAHFWRLTAFQPKSLLLNHEFAHCKLRRWTTVRAPGIP